ncbi:MAG: alanine--tRNA ligase [Eubacteriales bacterium]
MQKAYGVNELRKMFLEFFESKGHLKMKSFSLIPHNDKSLLLINSGMAPLKPYFTGQEIPPRTRVTTCQKCIRTGDIENVGKTARHGTFFEMLGNFSFGDYFKHEAIAWSWEFLTQVVGLDPDRLYPSVYEDDDEAFAIWEKEIGIAPERIFRFGKEDNFWEHGAGPCGPCSEIYYDRGEKYGCGKPDCTVGCDCDRYMEVWNNVFTQFDNDGKGHYTELEKKNIDTGMGLERLAVVVQDVDSIFDVDTLKALRDQVCKVAGVTYQTDAKKDVSIRLITDHVRSVTFMTSDGIKPSNEGRGYVLRRLLRRAVRHGRLLGIEGPFMAGLAQVVIDCSKDGYPELAEKQEYILKVIATEEEGFNKTIDQGLSILSEMEAALLKNSEKVLAGEDAFKLHDTYGFPLDLTREIMEEKGYQIDEEGFQRAMKVQRETARSARKTTNYMGADVTIYQSIDPAITSEFVGYDHTEATSPITVLTTEDALVQELEEGQQGTIIVEQTPFYATSGGQVADTGRITTDSGIFEVEDTIKLQGGKIGHVGQVVDGSVKVGETATLSIDVERRDAIRRNHSVTHLLQKALREVLGTHVEQAGAYYDDRIVRFDFSHFSAMTPQELKLVENKVNAAIAQDYPVVTEVMGIEQARAKGAMALFGEKYGDTVRVVEMGDYSTELCGGTHVSSTGKIGLFKILSESSVAAGVRRIEGVTGLNVLQLLNDTQATIAEAAAVLKLPNPHELVTRCHAVMEELKAKNAEIDRLNQRMADSQLKELFEAPVRVKGLAALSAMFTGAKPEALRMMGDKVREQAPKGVAILVGSSDGKTNMLCVCGPEAVKAGAHAGKILKEVLAVCNGRGGGRPDSAMGGVGDPTKVDEAMMALPSIMEKLLP